MAIMVKGVNRHEHHPDLGRAVPDGIDGAGRHADEAAQHQHRAHLALPDDPRWLDLCDQYGLYVIDEADLESHGLLG